MNKTALILSVAVVSLLFLAPVISHAAGPMCAANGAIVQTGKDGSPYPPELIINEDDRCCSGYSETGDGYENDQVCVGGPSQPDLTASNVTPTTATAGTPVTLQSTITNIGGGATGGAFTDLFQTAIDAVGDSPTDIGTFANAAEESSSFPALNHKVASLSYTFPTGGTYYVQACADKSSNSDTGVITESDETNNCSPSWTAITVAGPPSVTFSASPTSIIAGNSSGLTWTSSTATSCSIDNGVGSVTPSGGTVSVSPITTTTYNITCTNASGSTTMPATVTVTQPAPVATLTVTPTGTTQGAPATLNYACTNSTSASFDNGIGSVTPVSGGSVSVAPTAVGNTTYNLTCTGAGGTNTASATLAVSAAPAPTVTVTASPTSFVTPGSSTISWTSTNASSCSAAFTSSTATSGSASVSPTVTTAYSVTCTGLGGSGSNSATVTVTAPAVTASLTATPTSVNAGSSSLITWSSANATSCTSPDFTTGGATSNNSGVSVTPGSTYTYTLNCTGPGSPGSSTATVTVVQLPDITVAAAPTGSTSFSVGSAEAFSGTVSNIGAGGGSGVPAIIKVLNSSGSSMLGYWAASPGTFSIAASAQVPVTGSIPAASSPFNTAGTYEVEFCGNQSGTYPATPTNIVTEGAPGYYGNNCGSPLTVTVVAPVTATCSVSPSSSITGQSVSWTATPSGGTAPYTYAWVTTGGTPASGTANPLSTSYSTSGTKTASVTVTDSASRSSGSVVCAGDSNGSSSVTVTTALPDITSTTTPTGSTSFVAGTAEAFSGTIGNSGNGAATSVPNIVKVLNSTGSTMLGYWTASTAASIGVNGQVAVTGTVPAASSPFNTAGTYEVEFCGNQSGTYPATPTNVITESSYSNNCSSPLSVTVVAPVTATCSVSPSSATTGQSVSWTAVPAGGSGTYTYAWVTTGGTPASGTANPLSVSYSAAGTKTASVTVTDSASRSSGSVACTGSLTVAAALPNITATSSPVGATTATVGTPVTYTGTNAIDNNGTATATSFPNVLEIEDITTSVNSYATTTVGGSMTLPASTFGTVSETYTFAAAGTYQVRWCGDTNGNGTSGVVSESLTTDDCSNTTTVTVTAAAPTVSCSVSPTSITAGSSVIWTAVASGGTPPYQTYAWRTTGGVPASSATSVATTSATYSTVGTYTASVMVKDAAANSSASTACTGSLTVTAALPDVTSTTTPTGSTSFTAGTAEVFSGTIGNIGTGAATSVPNIVKVLNSTGSTMLGYWTAAPATVNISANGGRTAVTGTVPAASSPFNTAGTYEVEFCGNQSGTYPATPVNVITEGTGEYGNNCSPPLSVTVTAAAVATISACTPSPSTASPGQTVTWTAATTGFSPSPTNYAWTVTGGTPSSGSGSASTFGSSFATAGGYAPSVTATNGSQTAGPTACTPVTISGSASSCSSGASGTLIATPSRVESGQTTVIAYSASGIPAGDTCTITGPGLLPSSPVTSSVASSGCNIATSTISTSALTEQGTYSMTCTTWSGSSKTTVNVIPSFTEF